MRNILAIIGLVSIIVMFMDPAGRGSIPWDLALPAIFLIGIAMGVAHILKRNTLEKTITILIGVTVLCLYLVSEGDGKASEMYALLIGILAFLFIILVFSILISVLFGKR